jgi:excisionase family DNA binding protein
MTDPLLSLPAAAAYLSLSPRALRRLAAERKVAYYTPGVGQSHKRFRVSDLDRYLESCRVPEQRPRIEPARARLVGRLDGRPQKWD